MAPAIPYPQASRSELGRDAGLSAESPGELSGAAMIGVWVASVLTSWVLAGLVVAGIWWVVT